MGCPTHLDLCITIGDDWVDVLEFVTPDGSPFDLVGRTYRAEIRSNSGDLSATITADVVVDEVQLSIDAATTSTIAATVAAEVRKAEVVADLKKRVKKVKDR